MAEERKASIIVSAEDQTKQTFDAIKRSASDMAGKVEQAGQRANKGLSGMGAGGDQAAKKLDGSTRSIINSIQRATASMEAGEKGTAKYFAAIASQRGVGGDVLAPYLDQLRKAEAAQAATAKSMLNTGKSAKEMQFAMRGMPAQLTDIIVSLQGGQRPMTVLLQQGGQLKDMFGGIVPAARALATGIMGMVNPATVAAAAIGGIYMAYRAGASESEAFNKTIVMTGGIAGVTADQLMDMAKRIDVVAGTQRNAAAALNEFAKSGKIGAENLQEFSVAAIRWEEATGTAVSDTVKHFEELGKDPLKASVKLNESMNHLTASVHEQIRVLVEQGRQTDAAKLAQQAFSDALNERTPKILENLGLVEKGWRAIKNVIAETVDEGLKFGRSETLQDRLSKELDKLRGMEGLKNIGSIDIFGTYDKQKQVVANLQEQINLQQKLIGYEGERQRKEQEKVQQAESRREYLGDSSRLTRAQQMEKDIAAEEAARKKALMGLEKDSKQYRQIDEAHRIALANIKDKYKEKTAGGISTTQTELAGLHARIEAEKQRAVQLNASAGALANLNSGEKLALQYAEKIKLATKASTVAELERNKALATQAGVLERKNDEFEKEAKLQADTIAKVKDQTLSLQDQIATYGLGKSAIEAMIIARLEEKKAALEGKEGNEAIIKGINDEIAARQQLSAAIAGKERLDAEKKANDETKREWEKTVDQYGDVFRRGFALMLNKGEDKWKSFTTSLSTTFMTTVADQLYKAFAQPFVVKFVASMIGVTGAGGVAASGLDALGGGGGGIGSSAMSLLSTAQSIYSALSGGMISTIASGISSIGAAIGSSAVTSFAAGMTSATLPATASWAGSAAGISGAAAGTGSAGASAGAMAGAGMNVLGGIGLGIAGGTLISGKYSVGGGNTAVYAGTAIGAAVGSIIPVIGTAIGAVIGGVIGGAVNRTFGHAPRDYKDTSIVGSFNPEERFGGRFETPWTQKGGLFRSNKSGNKLEAIDDEMLIAFGNTFDMLKLGAAGLAASVGVSTDKLATFSDSIKVTLTDNQEENNKLIEEMLSGVGDNIVRHLVPNIAEFAKAEETATQTLQRLGTSLTSVNGVFEMLGMSVYDISLSGATLSSTFIDLFGGIESLNQATSTYFQNFFTETERTAQTIASVSKAFAGLGEELPASRDAFRHLVEAQDRSTESGQQMFVALMNLSPAFASVIKSTDELTQAAAQLAQATEQQRLGLESQLLQLQGDTVEIRRRELAALDESNRALQEQIWAIGDLTDARQRELDAIYAARTAAEQAGSDAMAALTRSVSASKSEMQKAFDAIAETLNGSINTSKSAISTLESMGGRLRSTLDSMRGQTDERASRAWAQEQISQARLAGVAPSGADFERALSIVAQPSQGLFATFEDYQLDFLKTANDISALSGITDKQLTIEQRTLKTLEDQLKAETDNFKLAIGTLDLMLETAQAQLDVAMGIDTKVLSNTEALLAVAAAIAKLTMTSPASYMQQNPDVAAAYANGSIQGNSAADAAARHYAQFGAQEGRDSAGMELNPALSYIANNPDVAAQFASYGQSQGMDLEEYAAFHYATHGRFEGRKFAKGGYYPGGMALVGEEGPELINFRNPGQVYTASQSADLMAQLSNRSDNSAALVSEIRALRTESKAQAEAIVRLQSENNRLLKRWDGAGLPETRELVDA